LHDFRRGPVNVAVIPLKEIMNKLILLAILFGTLGCQQSNSGTLAGDSNTTISATSGDPFEMLAVPTDPALKTFTNEFRSKFNADARQAIIDHGFWNSFSDQDRERNVEIFTADLGSAIDGEIKTIDFGKWDAEEYGFTPDTDEYELIQTPSHIMFFKSSEGPVSTDAYFAIYLIDGKYYLGTARSK